MTAIQYFTSTWECHTGSS